MNFQPRLFREVRSCGWLFPLTVIAAFLAGALSVLQSYQLSRVISGVFIDHQTLVQVKPILQVILGVVLLRVVFTFLNEVLAGRVAVMVKTRLRRVLLQKIDRLGPEFLKNESTGELTTTALQGVDALDAYFSQYLPQVLLAVMLPLTILVVVFPLDLLTGIVFLLTAPLIPLFMVLIGKTAEALTGRQWKALTQLGDYFLDTLQGIATLKMLGRNEDRVQEVMDANDHYRQTTLNVLKVTFLSALALELISTISTAVVAVEIGLRLLYSQIEFQQAFFILLIAPEFYLPLRNLSARYHAGMTGVTAARHIYELLDAPEPEYRTGGEVVRLESSFTSGFRISIRELSYTYPGQDEPALKDIDLEIHKGKHYALVGMSGSGKSTLARILVRFIEPDEGELLLDGEDIRNWSKENWRRYVGWLPQTPFIFNDTLLRNITLGEDCFTQADIQNAIETAGLTSVQVNLPKGLDTPLLEGGYRLSGGELQRVALARVCLRDPKLLVMDEPTAHLDPELERSLGDSIRRLMLDRTTLSIAHRLSTIQCVDEVFFMQDGVLVAQGCHADLLQSSQPYHDFIHYRERAQWNP